MNLEKIRKFVEENPKLVSFQPSTRYPNLYVVKYKRKVFYDNLWTPELLELRGLVVDKDWNVVVHPFTKIFNRGENGTDIHRDESVIAVRKINGFMACVTRYKSNNVISTTGSLDSDFVKLAEKYLSHLTIWTGFSYIFEICDPSDPHIVPERPGAYLIGMRDLVSGNMMPEDFLDNEVNKLVNQWHNKPIPLRPDWFRIPFGNLVDISKRAVHEGYVVYGQTSGTVLKIKSPHYLFNKFLARKSVEKLDVMLDNPSNVKKTVDEEFYPVIDFLVENKEKFKAMNEQERLQYIREFMELR
jgi:hypothetical protein